MRLCSTSARALLVRCYSFQISWCQEPAEEQHTMRYCSSTKDFRHAPIAKTALSTKVYEEPYRHRKSRENASRLVHV